MKQIDVKKVLRRVTALMAAIAVMVGTVMTVSAATPYDLASAEELPANGYGAFGHNYRVPLMSKDWDDDGIMWQGTYHYKDWAVMAEMKVLSDPNELWAQSQYVPEGYEVREISLYQDAFYDWWWDINVENAKDKREVKTDNYENNNDFYWAYGDQEYQFTVSFNGKDYEECKIFYRADEGESNVEENAMDKFCIVEPEGFDGDIELAFYDGKWSGVDHEWATKADKPAITFTTSEERLSQSAPQSSSSSGSDSGSSISSSSTSSDNASSSSSEASRPATYAETKIKSAGAPIKIGGAEVKTTVGGVYAAETVQGCAVTTPAAELSEALGLANSQKAKIVIYDTDQTKSHKAMECVKAVLQGIGGEMAAALNVDLGAMQNHRWTTLTSGSVTMQVGLPETADMTKTYSVICVQPGGAITILEDQDANPKTVTFEVKAGLGTYALVAK